MLIAITDGATYAASVPPASTDSIRALLVQRRYAAADTAARRAILELPTGKKSDPSRTADLLDLLVEAIWRRGTPLSQDADSLSLLAVEIREKQSPDDPKLVASLFNRGSTLRLLTRAKDAVAAFDRALALRSRLGVPDDLQAAELMSSLGVVQRNLGRTAVSLELSQRALAIRRGRLRPDDPALARNWVSIAQALGALSRTGEQMQAYREAIAIFEAPATPDTAGLTTALVNYASVLLTAEDAKSAMAASRRALDLGVALYGAGAPQTAMANLNLAIALAQLGDMDLARTHFASSLAANQSAAKPSARDLGFIWLGWGKAERAAGGRLDSALAMLRRGRMLTGPNDPLRVPGMLVEEAAGHWGLNDLAGMRSLLEQADAALGGRLGPEHQNAFAVMHNRALCQFMAGHADSALHSELAAEDAMLRNLDLSFESMTEKTALHWLRAHPVSLPLGLSIAAQAADSSSLAQIWQVNMQERGIVLDEMATRRRVASLAGDSLLQQMRRERADACADLSAIVNAGPGQRRPSEFDSLVSAARERKIQVEERLAARSSAYRNMLARSTLAFDDLSRSLQPGQALVAYVRYGHWDRGRVAAAMRDAATTGRDARAAANSAATDVYAAFVLPGPGARPRFITLGPERAIDSLVHRWRRSIAEDPLGENAVAQSSQRRAGSALRKAIWEPVASLVGAAKLAFVVPAGSLSLVNLPALPSSTGGYLVESGPTIHHLASERELQNAPDAPAGRGLLAFGAVDYDRSAPLVASEVAGAAGGGSGPVHAAPFRGGRTSCAEFARHAWAPLSGTLPELKNVAGLWDLDTTSSRGRGRWLASEQASEAAFKELAPGHRVIHLATHGFFVSDCEGKPRSASVSALEENPLLRSGIVLAGANRNQLREDDEDGILTAEEIASMDLSGVEWMVLSACETGIGTVEANEGVFGLRRAIALAGARTSIMSLWRVSDTATAQWMRRLYEARLKDGLSTAEAMRKASRDMLEERRRRGQSTSPWTWGAFIATGDWR
ncbi:MAG TPA: CHAT domain-containing tetratricopeptide repeat protein [Candidatus Eisenbacteria bacterium]|nr:CHAT domain-containing tetratricopeptide repeat protein [Candidatus Eisenbacteria bacterium]